MKFSYESLLTLENILADATLAVGDEAMRLRNKGFYNGVFLLVGANKGRKVPQLS